MTMVKPYLRSEAYPSGSGRTTIKTDGWPSYARAPDVRHEPHVLLPWVHRAFSNAKTAVDIEPLTARRLLRDILAGPAAGRPQPMGPMNRIDEDDSLVGIHRVEQVLALIDEGLFVWRHRDRAASLPACDSPSLSGAATRSDPSVYSSAQMTASAKPLGPR